MSITQPECEYLQP